MVRSTVLDRGFSPSCPALPGSGGLSVAHQIYDRFKAAGKQLNEGDVAVVDNAKYHYYQVRPCPNINLITTQSCPGASLDGESHVATSAAVT